MPQQPYDRNGRLQCKSWRFRRGEVYSVFAFHRPTWSAEVEHIGQHTTIFMYVDAADDDGPERSRRSFDAVASPSGMHVNQCSE